MNAFTSFGCLGLFLVPFVAVGLGLLGSGLHDFAKGSAVGALVHHLG